MTSSFNRSSIYSFDELSNDHQQQILGIYSFELSAAHDTSYVEFVNKDNSKEYLPLCMFMKVNNSNFTHGAYGTSYFSFYTITLNRSNDEAVVAYKHF